MSEPSSTKMKTPSVVSLSLAPRAGFCIKTTTLEGATLPMPHGKPGAPTPIPAGLKVFINIAWDVNAPPSPQGSEEAIERVLNGEEADTEDEILGGLYIPAILSPLREDRDKELALQRIEGQTGLILSRDVRTPNIASKGKLLPRIAKVPASLLLETPTATQSSGSSNPTSNERDASDQRTSLRRPNASEGNDNKTEEEDHEAFSQAILEMLKVLPTTEPNPSKRQSSPIPSSESGIRDEKMSTITSNLDCESQTVLGDAAEIVIQKAVAPRWSWRKEGSGHLFIEVEVPELTAELAQNSTLDVEPRRLILGIPNRHPLDINLALSDADVEKYGTSGGTDSVPVFNEVDHVTSNIRNTLNLKRERDLDVDGAEAQWKVGSGVVVIRV